MARKSKDKGKFIWLLMAIMALIIAGLAWLDKPVATPVSTVSSVKQEAPKEFNITEKIKNIAKSIDKPEKKTEELPLKDEPKQINEDKPKKIFKSQGKYKMAIVLDDFGYNNSVIKKYNAMPIPLTYAVLPYETYSTEVANSGYAAGKEIIVHLPMESKSNITPESITLRTNMTSEQIAETAKKAIGSIPHAIGINNHQGSKATEDKRVVGIVVEILANRGMFILDSRTSSNSVIPQMARKYGIRYAINELFLDNSNDVDDIRARLRQAAKIAKRDGSIIVIGHDRPNTAKAIGSMIDELQAEGIEFVFLSSLLQ